jgi:Fur family ferric uptake transcriptional regulator
VRPVAIAELSPVESKSTRRTRQRDALRNIIARTDRPLGVQELLEAAAQEVDGIGVATVYRTVNGFLQDGFVRPVEIAGEPVRYERADKGHHHHFHCESCGRVFDVGECGEDIRQLAPPRFSVRAHDLTLYGSCAECNARAREAKNSN